jgi:hypothetical protein
LTISYPLTSKDRKKGKMKKGGKKDNSLFLLSFTHPFNFQFLKEYKKEKKKKRKGERGMILTISSPKVRH